MAFNKFARRRFVVGTAAASAALIAAPFVRSAHAAGKLSVGLWDHWVPNANNATERHRDADQGVGGEGEGRGRDRLHHHPGQQAAADRRRRSAGQVGSRHPGPHELAAVALCRAAHAGERHHGAADPVERRGQCHRRVSRQGRRQVARGARDGGQPDQGAVLAHRPDEGARRHRRAGDVSGRRPAQGRRLDLPRRPATRAAIRSASASARRATMSTPRARSSTASAPCWSTPRATSR